MNKDIIGSRENCLNCSKYPSCDVWTTGDVVGTGERVPPSKFVCGRWDRAATDWKEGRRIGKVKNDIGYYEIDTKPVII